MEKKNKYGANLKPLANKHFPEIPRSYSNFVYHHIPTCPSTQVTNDKDVLQTQGDRITVVQGLQNSKGLSSR